MSAQTPARIYGGSCAGCGRLLVRGPSDPGLCVRCQRELGEVQR